jgi:hypothetical protein
VRAQIREIEKQYPHLAEQRVVSSESNAFAKTEIYPSANDSDFGGIAGSKKSGLRGIFAQARDRVKFVDSVMSVFESWSKASRWPSTAANELMIVGKKQPKNEMVA